MHMQTIALFFVGVFQVPLLLHFFTWVTRGMGDFDLDLTRVIVGIIGGSTIVALPLWLLDAIPIQGNAGPGAKAWFFGLMAGAALVGLLNALQGISARSPKPSTPRGRCPYCGHSPGFVNILLWNRNRAFRCSHCEKPLALDPSSAVFTFALVFVPVAIYVVGWGPPEDIPEWVIWVVLSPCLLLYPFVVKVVPAEVNT